MLAKHKHKVLFSPIHSATYDVQHVKLHAWWGRECLHPDIKRPDACTIELGKNNAYELYTTATIYHKESVLREILHMPVLVDRPSLAVDELIVTHTVMLSDFYTPM